MINKQTGIETNIVNGTVEVKSEWYDSNSAYHEPKKTYVSQALTQLFNDIKPN